MKKITIRCCGECPYCRSRPLSAYANDFVCGKFSATYFPSIDDVKKIRIDCPLCDMPSRRDLVTQILEHFSCHNNTHSYMTINQVSKHADDIADKLGLEKDEKES